MKRTLTVNLNRKVYNIDEDAYNMLLDYLTSLSEAFGSEEGGGEIVADIEGRIGELCDELLQSGNQVVSIENVHDIIMRLGQPEEVAVKDSAMDGAEVDGTEEPPAPPADAFRASSSSSSSASSSSAYRRLFRDSRNKMIGGVCSGVAEYLKFDPTWVRLAAILLFACFNGITLVAYLVLWVVLPVAKNPNDFLEMAGEEPTLESIGRTVADGYNRMKSTVNSEETRSLFKRLSQFLVLVAATIFKVFLVVLAVVAVPAMVFGCLALLASGCGVVMLAAGCFDAFQSALHIYDLSSTPVVVLLLMSGIGLVVAVPFFSLLCWVLRGLFSSIRPFGRSLSWTLFVLWCVGLAFLMLGGMMRG